MGVVYSTRTSSYTMYRIHVKLKNGERIVDKVKCKALIPLEEVPNICSHFILWKITSMLNLVLYIIYVRLGAESNNCDVQEY